MKKVLFITLIFLISLGCKKTVGKKESNISKTEKKSEYSKKISLVLSSSDNMLFDKNMLVVQSGQEVTLTLNHTGKFNKSVMGHNFVLLKDGVNVSEFAERAAAARDSEYIPEGDEVLAYTKLIGGGESDTITFKAPMKGNYTFICSFPGHWGLMKGKLIVK